MATHVKAELPDSNAPRCPRVILQAFGQAVERLELLVILTVLHLGGGKEIWINARVIVRWLV